VKFDRFLWVWRRGDGSIEASSFTTKDKVVFGDSGFDNFVNVDVLRGRAVKGEGSPLGQFPQCMKLAPLRAKGSE